MEGFPTVRAEIPIFDASANAGEGYLRAVGTSAIRLVARIEFHW
jgi:hypothetical protein